MMVVHPRCAGVAVTKSTAVVCAQLEDGKQVRSFRTYLANLREMGMWLESLAIGSVAVEGCSVHARAVWNLLEREYPQLNLVLVETGHWKVVPGRPTDVGDAEWLAHLHGRGLIAGVRVVEREKRELQDLIRMRRKLVSDQRAMLGQVRRVLAESGVKLSRVVQDVTGKAGMAVIRALATAERDPETMVKWVETGMKISPEEVLSALEGSLGNHASFLLESQLAVLESLNRAVDRLDREVEKRLKDSERTVERLTEMPGLARRTAQEILAFADAALNPEPTPTVLELAMSALDTAGAEKIKTGRTRKGLNCRYETVAYMDGEPISVKLVDISLGGGKLVSPQSFTRGQQLQLISPLPEHVIQEPVTALVVWCRSNKEHDGYDVGIRFEEAPDEFARSWVLTVLNQIRMNSQVLKEGKYPRAVANLPVEVLFKTKERAPGTAIFLGLGGVVVALDRPLRAGTFFTIFMGPLGELEKLELRCEVVSSQNDEKGVGWTHSAKFREQSTNQTKLLGRYVVDLLKAAGDGKGSTKPKREALLK